MIAQRVVLAALVFAFGATAVEAAQREHHEIALTPPTRVQPGQAAAAIVRLTPRFGFKINLEYPTRLVATAPAGVQPRNLDLDTAHAQRFDETQIVFRPTHRPMRGGRHRIHAQLRASVCDRQRCVMITEHLQWTIVADQADVASFDGQNVDPDPKRDLDSAPSVLSDHGTDAVLVIDHDHFTVAITR